jgi:hypothetical protein
MKMWRYLVFAYLIFMFGWFAICKMRNPNDPSPRFDIHSIPEMAKYIESHP